MHKNMITLEYRIQQLEKQLDEVVGFLNEALKMRKQIDLGQDDQELDRLLP